MLFIILSIGCSSYRNKIYGKLEDIENDFKKNISKALEELSFIDINSYEVENTLDVTKLQNYIDYGEQGGSYGATTGILKTRQIKRKDYVCGCTIKNKYD